MKYLYILLVFIIILTGCVNKDVAKNNYNDVQGEPATMVISKKSEVILPETMPDDFEIVFDYGFEQANQHDSINTKDKIITKDLVNDGLATAEFSLGDDEMESIYKKLVEINVIDYPCIFTPPYKDDPDLNIEMHCTPNMEYRLKVFYEGTVYELYWNNDNCSESEKAVKLKECFNEIIKIIRNTEEYNAFPEVNGGYD